MENNFDDFFLELKEELIKCMMLQKKVLVHIHVNEMIIRNSFIPEKIDVQSNSFYIEGGNFIFNIKLQKDISEYVKYVEKDDILCFNYYIKTKNNNEFYFDFI